MGLTSQNPSRAWRHLLALLAVLLVFGASIALLGPVIGPTSPWLALLLMFYFLAIAKVSEPLFVLRMPRAIYHLRHWEHEGAGLRRFGVLGFGRLLRNTPLRYLNSSVYLAKSDRDLSNLRHQAEAAEASHFWAAVLFIPCIALAASTGKWSFVVLFLLAELLVNVYPILHLRYLRGRLDRFETGRSLKNSRRKSRPPLSR